MHFDQNTIFIIVAAVIGISRLVARIAENAREQKERREMRSKQAPPQGQERRPIIAAPKTDEERVREFLEALGAPKGAAPPAKVQPRTDVPPRPVAPVSPPPIGQPFSPVILKPVVEKVRKIFTPPPRAPAKRESPFPEANAPGSWLQQEEKVASAAANFEAASAAAEQRTAAGEGAQNWRAALRSRESVRAALVLREILGPPRAWRELETT